MFLSVKINVHIVRSRPIASQEVAKMLWSAVGGLLLRPHDNQQQRLSSLCPFPAGVHWGYEETKTFLGIPQGTYIGGKAHLCCACGKHSTARAHALLSTEQPTLEKKKRKEIF